LALRERPRGLKLLGYVHLGQSVRTVH